MTAAHRHRLISVRWWGQMLLTVAAVLGAVSILVTLTTVAFDVRTLVFRSGSMEPQIKTGALAFAKATPAIDLEVGDVVSVVASNGVRVTHRIDALRIHGGAARLTLRGDANSKPDAETYLVQSADRVVANVPYAGYAIGYASGPVGVFVGGMAVAGLLWLIVRPAGPSERPAARGRRRAGAAGVVAAVAATGVAGPTPTSTWAAFNDTGTVQSAAVSTHAMVSQAQPACTNVDGFLVLGNIARLTWQQVDVRYEYAWELRQVAGTVVASGAVGGGQAVGATITVDISTGLIAANGNYNLALRARLRGATSWTAATETITPVRRASLIVIGLSMRCGHA